MMHDREIAAAGPTRNEQLAQYFFRAAGVAAIWIDPDCHVGAQDVAKIFNDPGRVVSCCQRGVHFALAYRLYEWKCGIAADQAAAVRKLEELARMGGVALTPIELAKERALAAVHKVNATIATMADRGELREFNASFKAARKIDKSVRYMDFLMARKASMIEALATEASDGH